MTAQNPHKKKDFAWKAGETIKSEDYSPLGSVKEVGFSKLADALYADPELRKQQRISQLKRPLKNKKSDEFMIENSSSGISEDYTPSNASKLIGKPQKITGLTRFKEKDPKK